LFKIPDAGITIEEKIPTDFFYNLYNNLNRNFVLNSIQLWHAYGVKLLRNNLSADTMKNPFSHLTDLELIHEFQRGNERCFEVLHSRHKSKIFSTIALIVRDRDLAEDLYQETLIKVIQYFRENKYNEEGKFLPWVIRIARNLAIDYFRKDKRNPMLHSNESFDLFNVIGKVEESPEKKIIQAENQRYIRNLIDQLPDKQKEVLIMRHYSDLSFKEISDLTQVSINTALGRMRYALVNLKRMMDETRTGSEIRLNGNGS
jgi:RNA polymerase sigma-70 factor (ECF subfamily)